MRCGDADRELTVPNLFRGVTGELAPAISGVLGPALLVDTYDGAQMSSLGAPLIPTIVMAESVCRSLPPLPLT
jgi:hypothetical protein